MRKAFFVLLVVTLVFPSLAPIFGQRAKPAFAKKKVPAPVTTKFGSAEAFTEGSGVWIRWRMESENQNLGFFVYRVDRFRRILVKEQITPGAAARIAGQPVYGEEYTFFDPKGTPRNSYLIETFSTAGERAFGPMLFPQRTSRLEKISGSSIERLTQIANNRGNVEQDDLVLEPALSAEVQSNVIPPDGQAQLWVAGQQSAKIRIKKEGFYRVQKAQLQAAGFDVGSDPANWMLFTDGNQQSINVAAGGDYIEFYGRAPIDSIESNGRDYYLVAGTSPGKRIVPKASRPNASNVIAPSYNQNLNFKERTIYLSSILNGDAENYWGTAFAGGAVTIPFNLSGTVPTASDATLTIRFQGYSLTFHTVNIALNGVPVGTAVGAFQDPFSTQVTIPAGLLHDGVNSFSLATSAPSGDVNLFDSFDLSFTRQYLADQNKLSFYTQNLKGVKLEGFTSPNVRIFDITYDGEVRQLQNFPIVQNGPTYYARIPAARPAVMYAVEDSAVMAPDSVTAGNPSTLSTSGHNGQLTIITYKDWMQQAQDWATYRRNQGISVEVVDVEDIYDEFNFGELSSQSLREFLRYAHDNWQTRPEYVLLLGDGCFDSKNYENHGFFNFIPVKIINTPFSETGSDEYFVDFNNNGLGTTAIGRIPGRDSQTISVVFNKVVAFEQPANQTLDRGALFAHDQNIGYDFQGMSERMRDQLPAGTNTTLIQRAGGVQPTLISALNTGKYVVNYSGHGSTGVWAAQDFFWSGNVPQLTNASNQSLFTLLTCLNGYFLNLDADSLSEKLLYAPNGGAVAIFASTGLTTPDIQEVMGDRFYNQLGVGQITRMGDLVVDAKHALNGGGGTMQLSFALLGDPMLKVHP